MTTPAQTPNSLPRPRRILIADDDAATRGFLSAALASLGYDTTLASDGAHALAEARNQRYDAIILDCRMPGGGAMAVRAALANDASAASRHAVALATSAEMPPTLRAALLEAGFAGVIEKPCQVSALNLALIATLGPADDLPLLDDAAGQSASGDQATLTALRHLLRDELHELDLALDRLATQPDELVDRMHRLRSACGFCGTTRLGAQARALQAHLVATHMSVPTVVDRFRDELKATLSALG